MPRRKIRGGAISASETQRFIEQSYVKAGLRDDTVGSYVLDRELSNDRAAVYHDPVANLTLVCNRGTAPTLQDWGNNALLATGQYDDSARFQNALDTQNAAIRKYGAVDMNVAHSQSQAIATNLNNRGLTGSVVSLNGATMPWDKQAANETRIRSGNDLVSAVQALGTTKKRNHTIKPAGFNLLTEHSAGILDRLNPMSYFGKGFLSHKRSNMSRSQMPPPPPSQSVRDAAEARFEASRKHYGGLGLATDIAGSVSPYLDIHDGQTKGSVEATGEGSHPRPRDGS